MDEEDNIYDTIIISDDVSNFLNTEQKTTELKFIDGKLYQKVLIINYGIVITQEERWDEIEGQ
jgi:hypothetical protein